MRCSTVLIREGNVLMTRPTCSGIRELPGGGVELIPEESIVGAAICECLEETGHLFAPDPDTLQYTGEYFFHVPESGRYYHSLTFAVLGTASDKLEPTSSVDPEEIIEVSWVNPSTLTTDTAHWYHLDVLRKLGRILTRGAEHSSCGPTNEK